MFNFSSAEIIEAISLCGGLLAIYTTVKSQLAVHGEKLSRIENSLSDMAKALEHIARHDERINSLEKRIEKLESVNA